MAGGAAGEAEGGEEGPGEGVDREGAVAVGGDLDGAVKGADCDPFIFARYGGNGGGLYLKCHELARRGAFNGCGAAVKCFEGMCARSELSDVNSRVS